MLILIGAVVGLVVVILAANMVISRRKLRNEEIDVMTSWAAFQPDSQTTGKSVPDVPGISGLQNVDATAEVEAESEPREITESDWQNA